MSNKTNADGNVPKLRFPEFVEPWKYEILAPYLKGYSERVPANTDLPIYSSTRTGLTYQKEYYAGQEMANEGEYGVVPKGYFVYRHMSDDGIFKFNINEIEEKLAVSKEYPVFRTVQLNSNFLLYKLNNGDDFKRFAMMQKKGGTRTRLYFNILCSWKTLLPSPAEQQKIADCLSSIDELIIARTQKLDALKAHKKGLMQQLFPAEGETVPKLRFPEFRNASEWKERQLVNVCQMQAGKFVSASDILERSAEGTHPCYGGNGLRGFTKTNTHGGKFPLIGRQGALCGNVTLATGKFHATEHAVVATPSDGVNVDWLFYLLIRLNLNQYATGQAQPGLSVDTLEKIPVRIPSEEEQRMIANSLCSIDNLIAAQTQKIEALKAHKKGLLQQLFPSADEAHV